MSTGPGRGGVLFDRGMEDDMGKIRGGSLDLGSNHDHVNVHGDGWHRSWDVDRSGDVSGDHYTDHGTREIIDIDPD